MRIENKGLDNILKLEKGKLVVLAGRPAIGKSDFTLDIVKNASKENKIVLMFNMESTKERILKKIFNNEEKFDVENLLICDKGGITIDEIIGTCKKTRSQKKFELIIIDYLQLIRLTKSLNTRKEEIDEIVEKIKKLSEEINIPIILVSELSRNPDIREDKRPTIEDFKDSVSVVKYADVIMFMYRESYYSKKIEGECMTELIVTKNKNGQTGVYRTYLK